MKISKLIDTLLEQDPTILPYNSQERKQIFLSMGSDTRGKLKAVSEISAQWVQHRKSEKFFGFAFVYTIIASSFLSYAVGQDKLFKTVKEYTQAVAGSTIPQHVTEIQTIDPKLLNLEANIAVLGYAAAFLFAVGFFLYRAEVLKEQDRASKATRKLIEIFRVQAERLPSLKNSKSKPSSTKVEEVKESDFEFDV